MSELLQATLQARSGKLNKIELLKQEKTPLFAYETLQEIVCNGYENVSESDKSFFLKCFGIFDKSDGTFMLRIRIPAGQILPLQAKVMGEIAQKYCLDTLDLTTRQQIEIRSLRLEHIPLVLTQLEEVGMTTWQTGIDNFRNIVTSPFDGLGEGSVIRCRPLIETMQAIFLKKEEWIGTLPRKFNTAILGNTTNDCNIYGHDCAFVLAKKGEHTGFNLYLGGKVDVQASDTNRFFLPHEVCEVYTAIIHLFKHYGFRDNRNKNRLHFLLEAVGMRAFVEAIENFCGRTFPTGGEILVKEEPTMVLCDEEKEAIYFPIPVGTLSGKALCDVADIAEKTHSLIRLSVEQSLFLITPKNRVEEVKESMLYRSFAPYHNPYFTHLVACAGNQTCSFGVIPNKPDALAFSTKLSQIISLEEGNIRLYWSGCPKGCGIHGVADIGFEGCKAKNSDGESVYGVHIFLGGKATQEAREGRLLYKAVPLEELANVVMPLIRYYRDNRIEGESFEMFDSRLLAPLDINEVRTLVEKG